jgi:hypothetical protein
MKPKWLASLNTRLSSGEVKIQPSMRKKGIFRLANWNFRQKIEKEWSENRVLIKIVKKMRETLIPNLQTVERVFFNGPTEDWDRIYQINSDDFASKMKEAKLWEEDWEITPRETFDLK